MGNETSTSVDSQFYSPKERDNQKVDLLGLLSLERGTFTNDEKDEKPLSSKTLRNIIPGDIDGHDDHKGSLRVNGDLITNKNNISRGPVLDECDVCRDTVLDAEANDHSTFNRSEKHGKLILLKAPGETSRENNNRQEDGGSDVLPSRYLNTSVNKNIAPGKKYARNQSQVFSQGSLRGTIEKNNENNFCKDPVLDAVAAGSAVRKANHERLQRSRQQQHFHRARSFQRGTGRTFSNTNEWKVSLRRLAKTAASTAKTVAHATAPVITDAREVIISSAAEFAQDVKKEWEREHQRPPENEIILSSCFDDEDHMNNRLYIDTIDESDERASRTEEFPSVSLETDIVAENDNKRDLIDETEFLTSESTFDEKKEIEVVGEVDTIDKDNDSPPSKKCIFEELKNMEKEFDSQIKSVMSNQNDNKKGTNDDVSKLKILLSEEDASEQDLSERSNEINFIEKVDSDIQILAATSSEQLMSSINVNNLQGQEIGFGDDSKADNEHRFDYDTKVDDEAQGQVTSTLEIRTRSGRVVKPVRRLVDGYDTTTGVYHCESNGKEISNDKGATAVADKIENTSLNLDETRKLQLASEPETYYKYDEETPAIGESVTDGIDTPSNAFVSNKIENSSESTTDCATMPIVDINESKRRKDSTLGEIEIKSSPLFSMNEDSLYQSEDTDTISHGIGTDAEEKDDKNISRMQIEEQAFLQTLDDSVFKDRKSIIKYVVTKLTGFEIEVKDKTDHFDLSDPTLLNDYPIVDSIFDKETLDGIESPSSSSMSLSSSPEIDVCGQKEVKGLQNEMKEASELFPMFDFIPAKREILRESDSVDEKNRGQSNVLDEKIRIRTLFKEGSVGSVNDSLGSFSTHQKSSNSLPFSSSRRSNRRLRRQGSRLSLALSNAQSKSPYATPVENRSLVDGKQQTEANLIDHGGQMVRWDTDIEANFPSVPDTEEMTEALERSELFHETLAAFSSLENIDFLRDFSLRKSNEVPKTLALLIWRQLMANWKHSESCKSMLTRPPSIQLSEPMRNGESYDAEDGFSSTVSTVQFRFNYGNIVLPNYFLSADAYLSLRHVNDGDYNDAIKNGFWVFTRFICDIGPRFSSNGDSNVLNGSPLRHNLSIVNESTDNVQTLSVTQIQREAKTYLTSLERVIDRIVKYSTQNSAASTDLECNDITSSCGVKDYASIRNKARRKYDGDISQVKDVLRGQITFPDEGSLICGLSSLYSIAEHGGESKSFGSTESTFAFKIVRLKNLFRTTSVGGEIYDALPTGYRHILLNIKFQSGLIAELQFQIAQLFNIMGEEGYLLHQEIVSSEQKYIVQSVPSSTAKKSTKIKDDFVPRVLSSNFVKSILMTPSDPNIQSHHEQRTLHKNRIDKLDKTSSYTESKLAKPEVIEISASGAIAALALKTALNKSEKSLREQPPKETQSVPPAGGIAALAAQAALTKSQKASDEGKTSKPPVGGIAALAAEAALKKSKEQLLEDNKGAPSGGIAALAAQAALKKSLDSLVKENVAKTAGGGIAALASQAALNKSQKSSPAEILFFPLDGITTKADLTKSQDTLDEGKTPKPPGGGIAALAAQAALKKSREQSPKEISFVPPAGGIAALAAQAALTKSQEASDEGRASMPPVGGIAALAAQAALKKSKEQSLEENKVAPSGGIAALAAQAAFKKSEDALVKENVVKPLVGGIAALASQAVLNKSHEPSPKEILFLPPDEITTNTAFEKSQDTLDEGKTPKPPGGGIATLAAQVSEAREQSPKEISFVPPAGGIAALAAQAALTKSQEASDEGRTSMPPVGGIAVLAAQAALKKSKEQSLEESIVAPSGGIAALAAQAALKKSQKVSNENTGITSPSFEVAALASQAALDKSQKSSPAEILFFPPNEVVIKDAFEKSQDTLDEVETPKPLGGGIAALAAQAALKKSREQSPKEISFVPPVGIAALAAQAALTKSQEASDEGRVSIPPVGGIAALAAQAALKKSKEQSLEENKVAPSGGIAALAAQAALKKSQKVSNENTGITSPSLGIAALASQAALNKSQKSLPKEIPIAQSGGIAALAAQAALTKSQEALVVEKPPKSPVDGIAALAAKAALKKSEKESINVDNKKITEVVIAVLDAQSSKKKSLRESTEVNKPNVPVGGIAALAAHAALKKPESGMNAVAALNSPTMTEEPINLRSGDNFMTVMISAVFEAGIIDAISNPRDVSAFCCLHLLASSLRKHVSTLPLSQRDKEVLSSLEISTFSRRLLLRSLSISNQATSIGMIGWLEYGSSNLIDRALNLPLEVLQQLSCNMAAEKDWGKASDVLCSLLLRCEQNLPRCHPTTICSMLDLAGALSKTQNTDFTKFIISQATDLHTNFLSEAESLFFDRRYFQLYCNGPSHRRIAFFDDCVDAVGIMKAFNKKFQENLSRDFLKILGLKHPMSLLNRSLVADSILVLANCLSASEKKIDIQKHTNRATRSGLSSPYYWSLAHSHYDVALRGWISAESLIHPNAASAIFSIARCLRELGKLQEALKLLETLASCLEQNLDDHIFRTKIQTTCATKMMKVQSVGNSSSKTTFTPLNTDDRTSSSPSSSKDSRPSFISRRRRPTSSSSLSAPVPVVDNIMNISYEPEQTAALCFWMMAVLTAEQNPDELGRSRALSLLNTASSVIQRVLSKNVFSNDSNDVDDQTRLICLNLYEQIEAEALDLFKPLEQIPLAKNYEVKSEETGSSVVSPRKQRAPWEILTPMRQKRQWASPRSRINRNRTREALRTTSNIVSTAMNSATIRAPRKSSNDNFTQRL